MTSHPKESEAEFRSRLSHRLHETRDEELEKLKKRFGPELARLEEAIRRAEARVERETSQFQGRALDTAVDFGLTLAGALFGRKLGSATNVKPLRPLDRRLAPPASAATCHARRKSWPNRRRSSPGWRRSWRRRPLPSRRVPASSYRLCLCLRGNPTSGSNASPSPGAVDPVGSSPIG
jgi:hypothetical protein